MDKAPVASLTLENGECLYYRLEAGHGDVLVFVNGLSDSMESWFVFQSYLKSPRPKLFLDLPGQGRALEDQLKIGHQISSNSVDDQVAALAQLFKVLEITRVGVIGFSYGGGVALRFAAVHGQMLTELILISPFILRLDLSLPWARFWGWQFDLTKRIAPQPLLHSLEMIENAYERFVDNYMNYRFEKQVPDLAKRRAAIALSRGIMSYNAFLDFKHLPDQMIHLITSGADTLVPQSLYYEFWERLSKTKKISWTHFKDGDHLLLAQYPESLACTINSILEGELKGEARVFAKDVKKLDGEPI